MAKMLRDGGSYSHREVADILAEFSAFKDRVERKFKGLSDELEGKANEHDLWVNLYLISTDYAEELAGKKLRQEPQPPVQKIS